MKKQFSLAAALAMLVATPAYAHLDPGEHGSFAAGFTHPVFGADHVLAMVAVGLWAGLIGGSALWKVPAAFVAAMVAGFGLAMAGAPLPFVEPAILASVVVLGLAVALAVKVPTWTAALFVSAFAVMHGHAHGGEMGEAGFAGYGLGFVLATALLHIAGLGVALIIRNAIVLRAFGAATAAAGTFLAFGSP